MRPEAARFLAKARKLLDEAEAVIGIGLNEASGRSAYLAGFHAAQALIFEANGRAPRTHTGVQSEFLRLTKEDGRFVPAMRGFLSRAYNLKAIADYEIGPGAEVSNERAAEALATGKLFVTLVAGILEADAK